MVAANPNALNLDRILATGQLPALPQSAMRLMELAKDPANGPAEFAVPIESDPGLTAQVLKFVNSSYFGFSRKICGVRHAATLVGIRTIKNFALWSAVFSLMPAAKGGAFHLGSLWQDSLRRALFARLVARMLGEKDAEEAFAASLLQDMSLPLLVKEFPKEYARLLPAREGGRVRLSALEHEQFGWNHADVGEELARRWNLPEATASLIGRHADAEALESPDAAPAERAVALAALLPSVCDDEWVESAACDAHYQRLGLAARQSLCEALARVDLDFADFAPALNLGSPTKGLVESLRHTLTPGAVC